MFIWMSYINECKLEILWNNDWILFVKNDNIKEIL